MPFKVRQLAYSFNQTGINLIWQSLNTVAVFYYVTVQHVNGADLSVGMIVFSVINAFMNLFAGYLSDRTNTRLGRRIPYILFGSFPLVGVYWLFFHPLSAQGHLLYFFLIMLLLDLFFTFVALNIGALYPEMYQEKVDRAFVSAWQQFFGILGLVAGVAFVKSLGQTMGWGNMATVYGAIGGISLYISLLGSFENPRYREEPLRLYVAIRETLKNYRFFLYIVSSSLIQLVTTMFASVAAFYSQYVVILSPGQNALFLGLLLLVALPMTFVWAKVAVRHTLNRMTISAAILYVLIAALFMIDRTPMTVIMTGALLGIPVAGFMVLLNMLLAEVIDIDERLTGKRREGMYLGINGFVVRLGLSLQYAIYAVFFAVSHFHAEGASDSERVIWGLRFLLGGLPLLLFILAIWLLAKYERTSIKKELFSAIVDSEN